MAAAGGAAAAIKTKPSPLGPARAFCLGGPEGRGTLALMRPRGCLIAALVAATGAWGAFERPSESDHLQALGNLSKESEALRRLLTPDDDFLPITPPGPGDWLEVHTEQGQSFLDYRVSGANRPDATRHIIYLLPLGSFPTTPARRPRHG